MTMRVGLKFLGYADAGPLDVKSTTSAVPSKVKPEKTKKTASVDLTEDDDDVSINYPPYTFRSI